jgi:hypothetical protein
MISVGFNTTSTSFTELIIRNINMDMNKIKSLAIYPSIGIARVGNSPDEYFPGPQIPGQHASDPDDFRDCEGRIKRQAAQFFIFALDENGQIIGEINESHDAKIDWKVTIANKKAGWYNFDLALDIPAAKGDFDTNGNATPGGLPLLSQRRNSNYEGSDRARLMITPSPISISGKSLSGGDNDYAFDDGEINGKPVYLGELQTDDAGRLVFLGGLGESDSFDDKPLTTFANNQGWHDDTSDGPVDAEVTLADGRVLQAEGAWVVTAPPNYAVGIQAFTTGYELLLDVAARSDSSLKHSKPTFYQHIYPILKHLTVNQWVNAGVAREFGWGSSSDFNEAQLVTKLSDPSDSARPFRQAIFQSFRNPNYKKMEPLSWPPLYGDAVTFNMNSTDPRSWYAITDLQYSYLEEWAKGHFEHGIESGVKDWDRISSEQQAQCLTEAALEETLGGPFHPGCEFTWPMRHSIMYEKSSPFRIKRRANEQEDFGIAIDYKIALGKGGPLDGSSPGDITKWMAVPWQSDTSSCLSAYRAYAGEYLPTFWPARVPNDVLTAKEFDNIESGIIGTEEKLKSFSPDSRKKWLRVFIYNDKGQVIGGSSISDRMKGVEKFTRDWFKAGIILEKELKADADLFPSEVWVETGRHEDIEKPTTDTTGEELYSDRPAWIMANPRKLR